MGQRTQVLVIKEKKDGTKKAHFFHHQWGYGRNMYLAAMDLVLQDYAKDTFRQDYDFLNCEIKTSQKFHNITDEIPENVLQAADIHNIQTIQEVFKYGDNNNGGMVVHIKEGKNKYDSSQFTIGFLLGDEDTDSWFGIEHYNKGNDTKAFARFLTPKQYGRMNGGSTYSDNTFVKMFEDFIHYFDVITLGNEDDDKEEIMQTSLNEIREQIDKLQEKINNMKK